MLKKLILIVCLVLIACGKQGEGVPTESAAPANVGIAPAPMTDRVQGGAEQGLTEASEPKKVSGEVKRYLELRHHLTIETAAEQLQASFDAAIQHCEALSCEMLNANFNRATPYNPPSASISVRIPPRNVSVFLEGLAQHGEIVSHSRESEDKTNQVVDTDARIKNLTELRDRLRNMLTDKSAKFRDLIEVERELANTQSELDSIVSQRKVLAQETDLVLVNIDFTATQGVTEQGFFAPVARALKEAGHVMMESLASVITFVVSVIPWLLVILPLFYLARKCWAKFKAKR
jgi:hypothetical protein